jgi:hypothetical protein
VREALQQHPERFVRIEGDLAKLAGRSSSAKPWGTLAMFARVAPDSEQPEQPSTASDRSTGVESRLLPYGETTSSNLLTDTAELVPPSEQRASNGAEGAAIEPQLASNVSTTPSQVELDVRPAGWLNLSPLIGEDGYLEAMFAAFEAGRITESQWHDADKAHRRLVEHARRGSRRRSVAHEGTKRRGEGVAS